MSGPVPLELQAKIAEWRRRAAEGTLTQEEMREAIVHLRAGRIASATAAATSRKKSTASPPPDAGDLLNELDAL